MITTKQVEEQLKKIKCNYTIWGSTEVAELSTILMDGEDIALAVNGYYEGGFGLLVATNFRVLIVDKKPFVLNLEDLRYDMITEVTYGARFIIATVHISLPTREVYFSSWSMEKLHRAMRHIQQHVMDARNGGAPLPDDWFASQVTKQNGAAHTLNPILKLARSAMYGHSEASVTMPSIGHRSSQRAVNPYASLDLSRRRKYPAVYH